MVATSWSTIDSEMQQRWCAKNEECEPFIRPYAVESDLLALAYLPTAAALDVRYRGRGVQIHSDAVYPAEVQIQWIQRELFPAR